MKPQARDPLLRILTLLALLLLAPACGERAPEPAPEEEAPAGGQLPPGHPPVGDVPPAQAVAPVDATLGTGEAALVWDTPASWTAETPASSLRRAQYRVPGEGGDGECVVYYFGPGMGGEAMPNAVRWANQFTQPDGRPSESVMEIGERRVGDIPVLTVEVSGSYFTGSPAMGGSGETLDGYQLLGAVAEGPDANWFFKFTGPAATVEQNRAAFDGMIESFRPGG